MVTIKWSNRYSDDMNNDDMGRWARVAYAGNFKFNGYFKNKRPIIFQIAWISKLKDRFSVTYYFPTCSPVCFTDLESAKKEVEYSFKFFIENIK